MLDKQHLIFSLHGSLYGIAAEHVPRLEQVGGRKPLGERGINRAERLCRGLVLVPCLPDTTEPGRGTQL